MKKTPTLSLVLALVLSTSTSGKLTPPDNSGHTIYISFSKLYGDISNMQDDNIFGLGYDYTTKTGVMLGGYYMPELFSVSESYQDTSVTRESRALSLYSGYQFANNIRLKIGLSFTDTEYVIETNDISLSWEGTNTGLIFGVDYLFKDKFLIGSQLSTHDVGGQDGATIGIKAGYKF